MRILSVSSLFKKVGHSESLIKAKPTMQAPINENDDKLSKLLKALEQIDVNKIRIKNVRGQ